MREITINGKRTWHDFGAMLAHVDEQYPEIQDVVETVPYGQKEYVFTQVYGNKTLGYRDIIYTFKLWYPDPAILEQRINTFVNWMYSLPYDVDIYDSETNYHYTGRLASFTKENTTGDEYGARRFACTFRCETKKKANAGTGFTPDPYVWPDVNEDGEANASDAALILVAAAKIGAGDPTGGLTPEQFARADANHDGEVTASDAVLVQIYSAYVSAQGLENNYETWYEWLNARNGNNSEVI